MKVMKHTVVMLTLLLLFSCKLERGTDVRSAIESKSTGQHFGDVAVTPLSFSNRPVSAWEIGARTACGDATPQRHSRLDDLEYEIYPESTYNGKRLIGKGDRMLCRYQPATAQNMENTRRLFADKALALKVKYLPDYSNAPPPHISFSSGRAINITPQKFGELFIGRCLAFQNVGGINFCKTKDRRDGRTIWVVPVAPGMAGVGGVSQHSVTTTIPGKGGGTTTITGPGKGGGTVTTPGKGGGTTTITGPGKGGTTTITTPGKGGQGFVGQSGVQTGGRITVSIKLPYMNSPIPPISVLVPSFNLEVLSILQGSSGVGGGLPPPVLPPNPDELYGSLLDGERISFMVIKPKGLFRNPNEAKFLKLTIKATETKPHEGRLSGVFKTAIGIPTAIVGGLLAVGSSSLGMTQGRKILGTTVFASGTTTTVLGVRDLKRWYDNITEMGAQRTFAVPNSDKCPALYGNNIGFTPSERYVIFKSEKQTLGWWKNIDLTYVRINGLRANNWKVEHNEAFTVFYCRKQRTKHCGHPHPDLITDKLKAAIDYCKQRGMDSDSLGKF